MTTQNRPLKLVQIVIAVPVGSETYMDILSDARDDSDGEIIEWAIAPDMKGGFSPTLEADGNTPEMLRMFNSLRVSPAIHPDALANA